jgi:hypothetical protein
MGPALALAFALTLPAQNPSEIVQQSVANTNRDWAAAPQFDFTEHDVIVKHGNKTVTTYQVLMIDGSPYNKVIAENGRPLSAAAQAAQERKLQREIERRRHESAAARAKRIGVQARTAAGP